MTRQNSSVQQSFGPAYSRTSSSLLQHWA